MAGRRPRLYDTVNKQWVDFNSLQEADSLFKDKEKNPFVKTKDYGVTSRYRYDEPLNNIELLGITLGGKPKKSDSTAAKIYKEAKPNVDLDKGQNAVGINPVWDRDYNFKKHPEWRPLKSPLYYPSTDEYWGYNDNGEFTNEIPENTIGSSERRKLQAESKDEKEERMKWLSEYYNFIEGGFDALSEEGKNSYNSSYTKTNQKMMLENPNYDPNSIHIVKGRALTAVAGKNAIDLYISQLEELLDLVKAESDKNKEADTQDYIKDMSLYIDILKSFSGTSNTKLAKISQQNEAVASIFDKMMDYYMLKYYGDVAKLYKDDPTNIGLDIEKHGRYAKLKKFIAEDTSDKILKADNGLEKVGWGLLGVASSLGNSLVNNLGVQVRDVFSSDEIKNEQRDRAEGVINTISDKIIKLNSERYSGNLKEDAASFDDLASNVYSKYKEHNLNSPKVYTDEEKRDLLLRYQVLAQVIGLDKAELNLLKELQNKDFEELGTVKRMGFTAANLFNTIATTIGHIGSMAWYAPLMAFDVYLAGADTLNGKNFWDSLGDEVYDTWNRSLDNGFVNYLSDVEHTGSWIPESLKRLKDKGIHATEILRKYGEENSIFGTTSTLYDIVPVTGYMIGSAVGAKGFNMVSNVMKSVGATASNINRAAALGEAFSLGKLEAAGWGAISRGTSITNKFLNGTSKFVDATAPAMATAGMDYGYAKSNYDEGMTEAQSYIQSPEFMDKVNDRINAEQEATEGITSNSSLSDKAAESLTNRDFYMQALLLANDHNKNIADADASWTIEDAAKELILKPYKDEYLEEAKKLATFNAGLTFGLTILPDVHMTNTWRKAMFSAQSRGAMNSLALNAFFKPIGKVLGIKPKPIENYIEGISFKNGKFNVEGKEMSSTMSVKNPFSKSGKEIKIPISRDLLKTYALLSYAGFLSNYLLDVGVAAGKGLLESMLNQYINQRFGSDATDSVSYDMTKAWLAAADKAGIAFGEVTSFRDGLYGALAPWIMSPSRGVKDIYKGIKQASKKGKLSFAKSLITEPILKNSLLYNVTFGAKDIINKENTRRKMLHNTIETWLNADGKTYIDNIGSLLNLSKQEKEAIEQGDYAAFNNSRLGLMATAAIMLSLILNFLPIKSTMMAYMNSRAERKEVNLLDIDRLNDAALQVLTLREQNNEEGVLEVLNSLNDSDKSILSDLIEIRKLNLDIKAKDSRTEVLQLNDLRNNAKKTLDLIDKTKKYYLEADAKFGDNADLVVKQEYARLKLYQNQLLQDVKDKSKLLRDIESLLLYSDLEASTNSTVPLNNNSVLYITEYQGNKEKLLEGIESTKKTIVDYQDQIGKFKEERRKNKNKKPTNEQELYAQLVLLQMYDSVIQYYEDQLNTLKLKIKYLSDTRKLVEKDEAEEETSPTAVIAAKDMLNLSEEARYQLLTAKKLSKALQEEVDKFKSNIEFANDSEVTNITSYTDLLGAKINSANALRNLSYEENLTPEAIERLNKEVANARVRQARDLYAKSFEGFANEAQYHVESVPNILRKEVLNEETGLLEVEESVDESQPKISKEVSDAIAYLNFVKAYHNKVKELQNEEESRELLLGLDKALKDSKNSLYEKMLENQKHFNKALKDIDTYIDENVFSKEEIDELQDMIEFATVYKGLDADNIMQTLSSLGNDFILDMSQFLKDKGHNPGSIEDIKNRVLLYNYNITLTIEKNKEAEKKRVEKKAESSKVAQHKKEAAEANLLNVINKVAQYTSAEQGTNMTPMRELLKQLGFGNADSLSSYSNNLLEVFRLILIESDAQTVKEMENVLDENFNKAISDPNVQLQQDEIDLLLVMIESMKNKYHRDSGSFKSYSKGTPPPSNNNNDGNGNTGRTTDAEGPKKSSRVFNLNTGVPYHFADLSWIESLPESERDKNILWNIIKDANVNDFLRNYKVTASTELVFITAKKWEDSVRAAIEKKIDERLSKLPEEERKLEREKLGYNRADSLPIIGAVKLTEFRLGCIPILNNGVTEYYLPLGVMPAVSKEANTAILRGNAKENPGTNDPYIITQTIMEDGKQVEKPLTTTITVHQDGVTIDVDAGPQPIELKSKNIITAKNFCLTEDKSGAKTNLVPSINEKSTSRANWAVMHIQEIDNTENADGKTLDELEGEDVINFNSRTKGFAEAIQTIVKILKENPTKFSAYKKQFNVSPNEANVSTSKTNTTGTLFSSNLSLNSRVLDAKSKVALFPFISLANGYQYYIDYNNGNIDLSIIHSNKAVAQWTLISKDPSNEVAADKIIKDISTLKYKTKEGEELGVGKWNVNWGNFNLDKLNGASPLQIAYIRDAINDKILYAFDVKILFGVEITPVKDRFAEEQLEASNREVEKAAALEAVSLHIDPVTGDTQGNAGITLEGMIDFLQSSTLDDIVKDARVLMLQKIAAIKSIVASKPKRESDLLKINQSKSRKKNAKRPSKLLIVSGIGGTVVDTSVRDYFNPTLVGQITKEDFIDKFKDVFNKRSVLNLWEALEQLNVTFMNNKWKIISTGVYTLDRADNNRVVGEVDLLAIDDMGNPHIIDIKTYSSNEFHLADRGHNYNNQVSMYAADTTDYTETVVPIENLHVYALKLDMNPDYYNISTDDKGVNTITKKPSYKSLIQIKNEARFEHFPVTYVGDAKIAKLREVRAELQISTSEVATLDPKIDDSLEELKAKAEDLNNNSEEQKAELKLPELEQELEKTLSPERMAELIALKKAELSLELSEEDILLRSTTEQLDISCRFI